MIRIISDRMVFKYHAHRFYPGERFLETALDFNQAPDEISLKIVTMIERANKKLSYGVGGDAINNLLEHLCKAL